MILRHQLPGYSPVRLRTLWPFGTGTDVAESLARDFAADAVWLTDSGTSALRLALAATSADREGPVALPAFGCYDLATAVEGAGSDAVLYDVDPGTLGPDEASLRRAVKRGASSIVAVHQYGLPVDLGMMSTIAADAGATLVEDAAQGAGAVWDGRPLGAFGTWSVLSFGRGKGQSAGGGGALLARDLGRSDTAAVVDGALREGGVGMRDLAGWLAQWALGRPWVYAMPSAIPWLRLGETIYHEPSPPRGISRWCRHAIPDALEASASETTRRRANATRLLELVQASPGLVAPTVTPRGEPGYLRVPVRATTQAAAGGLAGLRRHGVMRAYPKPLSTLSRFSGRVLNVGDTFSGAEELSRNLFTLPAHSRVTPADFAALAGALGAVAS